jgi:carboxyl-terminal processing protease
MDDLYARYYIGTYQSVLSVIPTMVDILASYARFDVITDEQTGTDVLFQCYILAIGEIFAGYVDSETATEEEESSNTYVGVGVSVTPRDDGYIDIIAVFDNSPAKDAGITAGDILTAVDGADISVLDYNEVLRRVRGEIGSTVSLTLTRDGTPYTVTLTRRTVQNVTVTHKMLSLGTGKTGFIRISEFSDTTFTEFIAAVEALEAAGATEFVFDVRHNPGGQLESVIGILEYILPDSPLPIVRRQFKNSTESIHSVEQYLSARSAPKELLELYAPAKDHALVAPIAVLCDEYTTSAGELFTSCLLDFGYAEVYGETTYGKGLGQTVYRVSDYYAYREEFDVTYYTYFEMGYFAIPSFYYSPPTSENYHGKGVTPHHTVTLSEEAKSYYISNIPEELDDQLLAAVAFVQTQQPPPPVPTPTEGNGGMIAVFTLLLLCAVAMTVFFVYEKKRAKAQAAEDEPNHEKNNLI